MAKYNGWVPIGESLGRGGQGVVYKALAPEYAKEVKHLKTEAHLLLSRIIESRVPTDTIEFIDKLLSLTKVDGHPTWGALKLIQLPTDEQEREIARGRLKAEMRALTTLKGRHAAILGLLDCSDLDADEPFIVTEFHPGTLSRRLSLFQGRPLEALKAIVPLIEATIAIHKEGVTHRDIKTANIFVGDDERLILGDFGLAFFQDGERNTKTFQKVGSHFWIPPWAWKKERLDANRINASLDLFPLAKVLWSMISGQDGFDAWDFNHNDNNLCLRFPDEPLVEEISNVIFKACLVRDEDECLPDATQLLDRVNALVGKYTVGAARFEGRPWACTLCGVGRYRKNATKYSHLKNDEGGSQTGTELVDRYVCDNCGHVQFFAVPTRSSNEIATKGAHLSNVEATYEPNFTLEIAPDVNLTVSQDGEKRYVWRLENTSTNDFAGARVDCVEYRTFDVAKREFRPWRDFKVSLEHLEQVDSGHFSPRRIFAHFPDNKLALGSQSNQGIPVWPPMDREPIHRWLFHLVVTTETQYDLFLLIRSTAADKSLLFRRYFEDMSPTDV